MNLKMLDQVQTPTLVLDESRAKRNLRRMAAKAAAQNIRFRPHFKTHQSALIGEWFREVGVTAITVSSLGMAAYFADNGWDDILVAFPVNLREMDVIQDLAGRVRLGLLVESPESVACLSGRLDAPLDIWVKVDTGLRRAGLDVQDEDGLNAVLHEIQRSPDFNLRGLLTHAGQTYHAHSVLEIQDMYARSWQLLDDLRVRLAVKGFSGLEISVGDTPGCSLSADLGRVDEIRPGNFIFFDSTMAELGVCTLGEIAVAVACPVVALHPQRNEVVIYGGAVHLSKEMLEVGEQRFYGYAAFPNENGWQMTSRENKVIALSQEHGVVHLCQSDFKRVKIGGLLYILPVHSCLVVDALEKYLTLQGRVIPTFLSRKLLIKQA